jgi:hypothetical protein
MPGGAVHMHDSEKARNYHQNVLMHHLLGAWRTDFTVSHTPKPVIFFGVLKAAVPLGVHARPQQGLCPVISMCFLCSHAREYLFSRTWACCLHWRTPSCFLDVPMQHALAFIGKVVTGSLPRIYICAQKDTQTHEGSCAHKKHSELARQKRFFGLVATPARCEFCSPSRP